MHKLLKVYPWSLSKVRLDFNFYSVTQISLYLPTFTKHVFADIPEIKSLPSQRITHAALLKAHSGECGYLELYARRVDLFQKHCTYCYFISRDSWQ